LKKQLGRKIMHWICIPYRIAFKKSLDARSQREYIFNFAYFGGNFF
jgi:hypothetical protein